METLSLESRKFKIIRLILINSLPLFGVLFLGWSLFFILFYYWLENVVIGLFNVLKMIAVMIYQKQKIGFFLVPFFIFHFGSFVTVHLFFLLFFFATQDSFLNSFDGSHQDLLRLVLFNLLPMIFGYVITFVDFTKHHLADTSLEKLMFSPYLRIFVMHLVILAGGGLLMVFGVPAIVMVFLIFVKIIMDYLFSKITFAAVKTPQPKI